MRITALVGGITLAAGVMIGWKVNGWRLEARIADLQATHAQAYAEAQKAARAKETALADDLAKIRRTKDAEIKNIRRGLDIAINSLRNRPDRSILPTDSVAGGGCTGAGLARPDAQFLAEYAHDAARLQLAYQTCIGAYEAARKALE
jgi:hypothetical protein